MKKKWKICIVWKKETKLVLARIEPVTCLSNLEIQCAYHYAICTSLFGIRIEWNKDRCRLLASSTAREASSSPIQIFEASVGFCPSLWSLAKTQKCSIHNIN